jgi:hypothetical protein
MLSLRSQLRLHLLTWFKLNPARRVWVRGLAATLQADPTNVSRELARLECDGILRSEIEGRQRYYALDTASPSLKPFLQLLGDSIGIEATLAAILSSVPGLESVFLYAPRTKGAPNLLGELKLLLIGAPHPAPLAAALSKLGSIFGKPLQHRLFTHAQLTRRMAAKDPSLKDFWHVKPIPLKTSSPGS